ncbi:MAG: nucleoside deaminase [Bacilli bacterium]
MIDKYMDVALLEAKKAYKKNEIPVGAVIVKDGSIIAKAHNSIEKTNSILNHAEIIAIKKAMKHENNWRLNDCVMYVTLKPCKMCLGAIIESRIKKVYYAAEVLSKKSVPPLECCLSKKEESTKILQNFFLNKRK